MKHTIICSWYRPPIDEVGEGVAGRSDDITSTDTEEARERWDDAWVCVCLCMCVFVYVCVRVCLHVFAYFVMQSKTKLIFVSSACRIYILQTALLQVSICGRQNVKENVVPALKSTCWGWRRLMVVAIWPWPLSMGESKCLQVCHNCWLCVYGIFVVYSYIHMHLKWEMPLSLTHLLTHSLTHWLTHSHLSPSL